MSYDKMDSSAVYALFEEIKSKLDKKTVQAATPVPSVPAAAPAPAAIRPEDLTEIRKITESIKEVVEAINHPQRHIHRHTIDMMSNKMLVAFVIAILLLIISFCIIVRLWGVIDNHKDNDLKYRYIEMKGAAVPDDIQMLRDVFDYNRNPEGIKEIRQQVEQYERLVREQAKTAVQARLNAQQSEQFRQEAESVKSRK